MNADGVPDLWVGASFAPGGGEGHMLLLNANGTVASSSKVSSAPGGRLSFKTFPGNFFAHSGTLLGQLNNGTVVIAVGAIGDKNGGDKTGSVYMLKRKWRPPCYYRMALAMRWELPGW